MYELIKITENNGQQVISARELHKGLEIAKQFKEWFASNSKEFIENEDYIPVSIKTNLTDYALTIDTAKHICLLSRTENGRKYRKYLIDSEKQLKGLSIPSYQIEDPIARAERWIIERKETLLLQEENKKLQFRSDFVDVCFETDGIFALEEVCKILKLDYGRNTMMTNLRSLGVLLQSNTPKQNLINNGYFKVVETLIDNGKFRKLVSTTYATQKGIGYIHKILNKK